MSESKSAMLPDHDLKPPKPPLMAREYAKVPPPCQADRAGYPACLLHLAEREVQDHQVRAAQRHSKAARLRLARSLHRPDFAAPPPIDRELVTEPWQATAALLDGHEPLHHVHVVRRHGIACGASSARGGAR